MRGAVVIASGGSFSIQVGPTQDLEVSVFSATFTGTYQYTANRVVGASIDALGEWTQESEKKHTFKSVGSLSRYDFLFTWSHPIAGKSPVAKEKETSTGATILFEYNSFEFVRFKLKRV